MASQQQWSRLCEVCEHINFAAILTPREYDTVEGTIKAIYRPEWSGNGSWPTADWMSTKERKSIQYSPGTIRVRLPITKTARYEELSDSECENDDIATSQIHHRDRGVVIVGEHEDSGGYDSSRNPELEVHEDDNLSSDARQGLAAELSDIEDDEVDTSSNRDVHAEEEDSESDASVSTWSGLSHFTENERIDLNKQAAGNWNYCHGQLYYLGSIWDVRSRRRRCDLCRELWNRMRKNRILKDEYITKSRCILKLMELNGKRVKTPTRAVTMLNLTFIYGYKLGDPRETGWHVKNPLVLSGTHRDVCELDEQNQPGQILSFQDRHYGEGRWKHDRCNFDLLRGWLRTCTTKHDHPALDSDVKVKMRLIDVVRMCLVEFDASTSVIPDYVALSYTWGTSKARDMLQKSRLKDWTTPGALKRANLNATLRDALKLCSGMDQKYLWIDSLCIIQDDPNDKMQQIPQMREIYGLSLFTIVAAHGDNVNAGLPRVSGAGSSKFKLELKDIRVQSRGSCKIHTATNNLDIGFAENYIRNCAYLRRAWTFQEGILSPRVLIFATDKVYWECDRCTWCEDAHWESDEIDFVGLRAIKGSTPDDVWNDRFERHAHDRRTIDEDSVPPPNSYAAIVKEYTGRNLTWDSDVLHACNGVLASIKEREQSDFIFGLRSKHFGNDLLFSYWTAIAPRFPGKTATQSGFPSWSWTAWKGRIQVANQARGNSYDLAENLVPCDGVRAFMLQADEDGALDVRVINQDGGWKFEQGYVRTGEGIYDPTELNFEHNPVTGRLEIPKGVQNAISSSLEPGSENEMHGKEDIGRAEEDTDILAYDQDITLAELVDHPAISRMKPNLHIAFKTFSTLVVVVLDYDDYVMSMEDVVIGGTVMVRSEGVWGNKDRMQRKVYACRKKTDNAHTHTADLDRSALRQELDDVCPCCGKDAKRKNIPDGYELGPYLGRLPALSTAWDKREYLGVVPDGLYRMLWMNNNQLPMFGHMLCKPVSPTAPKDGRWDGEIMQRVSAVIGPTEIITKACQDFYCARWGIHVLV